MSEKRFNGDKKNVFAIQNMKSIKIDNCSVKVEFNPISTYDIENSGDTFLSKKLGYVDSYELVSN